MTYSIVARDGTGHLGVAVQSHVVAVGGLCPWASPGIGAVATQAFVEPEYGPKLLDLLASGRHPADAVAELTAADRLRSTRQVAVVDAGGRVAVHTGDHCIPAAGHSAGDGFSVQANMMLGPGVPEAMAEAFTSASGSLPLRLLAALDAAEEAGGDIRGAQSAALIVVASDPGDGTAGRSERPMGGRLVNLRVDDHGAPLSELRRLVDLHRAQQDGAEGAERFAELARGNPELWFWHGIGLAHEGKTDDAREALDRAYRVSENWRELLRRLRAPIVPDDPGLIERLIR